MPIRHWLRDEMYDWARGIIRDAQADHLVDLAAVQRMLDAHRDGPIDHSRRIWTLLVFLLWHGIFVEQRIRPEIPEPSRTIQACVVKPGRENRCACCTGHGGGSSGASCP